MTKAFVGWERPQTVPREEPKLIRTHTSYGHSWGGGVSTLLAGWPESRPLGRTGLGLWCLLEAGRRALSTTGSWFLEWPAGKPSWQLMMETLGELGGGWDPLFLPL